MEYFIHIIFKCIPKFLANLHKYRSHGNSRLVCKMKWNAGVTAIRLFIFISWPSGSQVVEVAKKIFILIFRERGIQSRARIECVLLSRRILKKIIPRIFLKYFRTKKGIKTSKILKVVAASVFRISQDY